jgi:hypothetical protein
MRGALDAIEARGGGSVFWWRVTAALTQMI